MKNQSKNLNSKEALSMADKLSISEEQTMEKLKEYLHLLAQAQLETDKQKDLDPIDSPEPAPVNPIQDEQSTQPPVRANARDKLISLRVNGQTYELFKKLCAARGIPMSTCFNMMMMDFVRENKKILEE